MSPPSGPGSWRGRPAPGAACRGGPSPAAPWRCGTCPAAKTRWYPPSSAVSRAWPHGMLSDADHRALVRLVLVGEDDLPAELQQLPRRRRGRAFALPEGARRRGAAGRHARLFPRHARGIGQAEGALDPRHRAAGLGSARLDREPGREVDAAARPARADERAGAARRLHAAGAGRDLGSARRTRPVARMGARRADADAHLAQPRRLRLARGGALCLHRARIRIGGRAARGAAHPHRQHHRHHGRAACAGGLCRLAARRAGGVGEDRARPASGARRSWSRGGGQAQAA